MTYLKLVTVCLLLATTACSSRQYEPQPSRVKEVVREDGTVVQEFIVGYSIEDFLGEFGSLDNRRDSLY